MGEIKNNIQNNSIYANWAKIKEKKKKWTITGDVGYINVFRVKLLYIDFKDETVAPCDDVRTATRKMGKLNPGVRKEHK